MLLRTLFALLLFAALAETIVHGIHALAQVTLHRQALLAVHGEIASATTAARDALARAIAGGADPRSPDPSPLPPTTICRLHIGSVCALAGRATIAFSSPGPAPSPCPSDACSVYEQENDSVAEGRIDATVVAQALSNDGDVLASRVHHVTFRTLRVAPYAAMAGEGDATSAASLAGDDAGAAPIGAAPGTLIDVLYENARTGATMPANVWHAQAEAQRASRRWKP